MSRFDTIFIVRDLRREDIDKQIASHVVNLHMHAKQDESSADISIEDLRKYITYAKMKIYPRLSEESAHMLQDMYVTDRMNSRD